MRSVIRRRAVVAQLLVAALVVVLVPGPAAAQSPTPSPTRGPSVNGEVTGALAAGSTLTIRIDGTMPGGWEAFHLLEATITSGNQELDRLRFDIEDNKLTVGDRDLIVGTGATATSEYLRVNGADVIVTTGGANLSFEVDAKVLKTIPGDARFVLGVVDDLGGSAHVPRSLAAPEAADHLGDRARAHSGRLFIWLASSATWLVQDAECRPAVGVRHGSSTDSRWNAQADHRTLTGSRCLRLVAVAWRRTGMPHSVFGIACGPAGSGPVTAKARRYVEIREFPAEVGQPTT